jgi:phosphoglycolate phosphatase
LTRVLQNHNLKMTELTKNKIAFANLKKPKAIIFDWDNTLVDTWPLIQHSIDETMQEMGREPWGLEKVRDNVHKSMRESFPEMFGENWEKAGEFYKNTYRSIHLNKLRFLSGSLELIKEIQNQGIVQFVVSNKMGPTLRKETKKLAVDDLFFATIGAQDAYADKPSRDPVDLALLGSDIQLGEDEVWFIGDTIADIECAYNSGCTPIVYGHSSREISKTIPQDILENGRNNQGPLAAYFDHAELIKILNSF